MAYASVKSALSTLRRVFSTTLVKSSGKELQTQKQEGMLEPMQLLTGIAFREQQALACGVRDPWGMAMRERAPATRDCPCIIPSAFDSRIIGCICHEDANTVNWMILEKYIPKRCECGCWFKLVDMEPFH